MLGFVYFVDKKTYHSCPGILCVIFRYIANDLNFCGEDTVGFNYAQCSCKWDSSQKKVFWQKASSQVLQLIDNCAAMS